MAPGFVVREIALRVEPVDLLAELDAHFDGTGMLARYLQAVQSDKDTCQAAEPPPLAQGEDINTRAMPESTPPNPPDASP